MCDKTKDRILNKRGGCKNRLNKFMIFERMANEEDSGSKLVMGMCAVRVRSQNKLQKTQ